MSDKTFTFSTKYDVGQKIWYTDPLESSKESMGEIIFEQLQKEPEKICQISDTEKTFISKKEMLTNAIRVAMFFEKLEIKQKDIIGLIARNTTHVAALVYGCFFNGTAYHALNTGYEAATIGKLFNITKPKLIFCDEVDYEKVFHATRELNAKIYTMKPNKLKMKVPSMLDILQTPINENYRPVKLEHGTAQTLAILCSSGTTGLPKAVTITNSHKIFQPLNLCATDVQYSPSTMDWLSAFLTLTSTAVYGTTRIISDVDYNAEEVLRMLKQYQITWLLHAPTHVAQLLNCSETTPAHFDTVKQFIYGGGNLTLATERQMQAHLRNGKLICMYGLTEVGSMVSINYNLREKPGSIGLPVYGYKVKIIDEAGTALGPGEKGEICCNNEQYWPGYYNNLAETENMRDKEGWFHTGDIGYFDADMYLYIIDRKKDMLKYKNIMYYPAEIEEVIAKMPNVADVCVFGNWNELEGDAAAAAVVKRFGAELSAEEVVEFVRQQLKAKYKQLNGGVFIVDELKKSPNGKLNRRAMKDFCLNKK